MALIGQLSTVQDEQVPNLLSSKGAKPRKDPHIFSILGNPKLGDCVVEISTGLASIWYSKGAGTLIGAAEAMVTFTRRGTPIPSKLPVGLREDFASLKGVQWSAFVRKSDLQAPELGDVLAKLRSFCARPLQAAATDAPLSVIWKPDLEWL